MDWFTYTPPFRDWSDVRTDLIISKELRVPNKGKRAGIERFLERVLVGDGCWEWTGTSCRRGYGTLMVRGHKCRAHHVGYEIFNGPVPSGMYVCHRCDNPRCVRASHLFIGTAGDNAADRHAKDRDAHQRGESQGGAKLTDAKVREIRERANRGENFCSLGRAFGVTEAAIRMAVTRRTWSHVL